MKVTDCIDCDGTSGHEEDPPVGIEESTASGRGDEEDRAVLQQLKAWAESDATAGRPGLDEPTGTPQRARIDWNYKGRLHRCAAATHIVFETSSNQHPRSGHSGQG
jgi:hypothetical protein